MGDLVTSASVYPSFVNAIAADDQFQFQITANANEISNAKDGSISGSLQNQINNANTNINSLNTNLGAKAPQTALNDTNTIVAAKADKTYVDSKFGTMGSTKTFKGSCTNTELLTKTGMAVDDYWYITDLTTNKAYNGTAWVDIGNNLKIGDSAIEDIKTDFVKGYYNFADLTKIIKDTVVNLNGTGGVAWVTTAGLDSIVISVKPNTKYYISMTTADNSYFMNGTYAIGTLTNLGYNGTNGYYKGVIITPSNCDSIICTFNNAFTANFMLLNNVDVPPIAYIPYGNYKREIPNIKISNSNIESEYRDKTAVWFGTSIPAGGYPLLVGNKLGLTVYNEAVASSCLRAGYHARVTDIDVLGAVQSDDYASMVVDTTLRSLTQTVAEKQNLYALWNLTFDDATWQTFLNCSYERKVDKYLEGGAIGSVDYYIFDHGHNDMIVPHGNSIGAVGDMLLEPTNEYDRTYFIGAMRFIINRILTKNPKAKIIFVGHYESARKTEIYQAQEKLATEFEFPILKLWEYTGWTQKKITINKKWENGHLVDSTTANTFTMTQLWLADDLHPSSDLDGNANEYLANIIAKQFKSILV